MLDIISIVVISAGFIAGYRRGLVKTIFDAVSILIGVIAAIKLSPIAINYLESTEMNSSIAFVLGTALSFAGLMLIIRFLGRKLEDFLKALNINIFNRLAGGIFQALFFAIVLSYGLHLLDKVHLLSDKQKFGSKTYAKLQSLPEATEGLLNKFKPFFEDFWEKTNVITKEKESR